MKINLALVTLLHSINLTISFRPLVITSNVFLQHVPQGYHPECPDRISACIEEIEKLSYCDMKKPSGEHSKTSYNFALNVAKRAHTPSYIDNIQKMCEKNYPYLSHWDQDTYISPKTFEQCIIAQSAWIDGVNAVINDHKPVFALTRPPGHHASTSKSMGFCMVNFAVGAALYAIDYLHIEKVAILDFDVHFGNGIAEMISPRRNIRYCSIHEDYAFPYGMGKATETGHYHNILNLPLPGGLKWNKYQDTFQNKALPYLKEFNPDLVIVSAGYDALASDELSTMNLLPQDYKEMAILIKQTFGSAVLFGLEGGYSLRDLPKAVCATLSAFEET